MPRNASVRSVTHSELMVLDRADLKKIVRKFSDFAISLHRYAAQSVEFNGWAKIRHAFRMAHIINKMGGNETLFSVMCMMNGLPRPQLSILKGNGVLDSAVTPAEAAVAKHLEPKKRLTVSGKNFTIHKPAIRSSFSNRVPTPTTRKETVSPSPMLIERDKVTASQIFESNDDSPQEHITSSKRSRTLSLFSGRRSNATIAPAFLNHRQEDPSQHAIPEGVTELD